MKKQEFLDELRIKLNGLPKDDLEERISFYGEMIDDRVSEGKSEEVAISEIGGVDKVVDDVVQDTPLYNLVKERMKPKKELKVWEVVLIIVGFPLWFPLLLVFIILCLLGYLLIWVGVLVSYAIEAGLAGATIWGLVGWIMYLANGTFSMTYIGIFLLGVGAAILFVFACIGITKATIKLSKHTVRKIKSSFIKKGETK